MEAKFFSEIQKKMDIKTLKDFEREVRSKIIDELEVLRDKNDNLFRILMRNECDMWVKIRDGGYSWLKIKNDKKKKLFRLIDIYSSFDNIIVNVKELNKKVERIKELNNNPVDSE